MYIYRLTTANVSPVPVIAHTYKYNIMYICIYIYTYISQIDPPKGQVTPLRARSLPLTT